MCRTAIYSGSVVVNVVIYFAPGAAAARDAFAAKVADPTATLFASSPWMLNYGTVGDVAALVRESMECFLCLAVWSV